ncbi:hypothetical protein, partial [Dyella sp. ASV21]|uniref:hypothetical protein n=1 Tax=Dyella sp. ASV21 TaxID=2795114 RepID=UPI001E461DB2
EATDAGDHGLMASLRLEAMRWHNEPSDRPSRPSALRFHTASVESRPFQNHIGKRLSHAWSVPVGVQRLPDSMFDLTRIRTRRMAVLQPSGHTCA